VTLIPSLGAAIVQLASSNEKHDANIKVVSEVLNVLKPAQNLRLAICSFMAVVRLNNLHPVTILKPESSNLQDLWLMSTHCFPHQSRSSEVHSMTTQEHITTPHTATTCTTVHSDYAAIGTLSNSSLVAYFQRPNAWAKYMSISPSSHQVNTLKVELTTIFPRGYGVDTSPFEIVAHDWLVDGEWQFNAGNGSLQGFGMYDLHDYTSDRHRRGLTVEDRAQVWFAKAN
jgi:hypothetical protein